MGLSCASKPRAFRKRKVWPADTDLVVFPGSSQMITFHFLARSTRVEPERGARNRGEPRAESAGTEQRERRDRDRVELSLDSQSLHCRVANRTSPIV